MKEEEAHEEGVPEGEIVYRSARQDGEYTLARPSRTLAWSGLAAGLSMGFSLAGEAILRAHLPEASWTPLVAKLGYALGFLIVILGRQELFTEQTLTAVLPWLSRDRRHGLADVARVWAVIFAANIAGTACFAAAAAWTPLLAADVREACSDLGNVALASSFATTLVRGIAAGFLIAIMVWMLPGAGAARVWIIVILTWLVGVLQLSHVIAGSAEGLFVVFRGEQGFGSYLGRFLVPTVIGNSVGGVALVAALAHAQHAPDEST